jgi:ATP synthase F1 gamma subunit
MAKKFIKLKNDVLKLRDLEETIKAIEKISASEIHLLKKQRYILKVFRENLENILQEIEKDGFNFPFFKVNSEKRLLFVISSDKGNCGGLFHNLLEFLVKIKKEKDKVYIFGRKGEEIADQKKIKYDFSLEAGLDFFQKIKDKLVLSFLKREVGKIYIVYPEFKSLTSWHPTISKFLPIEKNYFEKKKPYKGYVFFEPSKRKILNYLIEEYLEVFLLEKIVETKLCEFSARTVTMEKAEEKTKKLIKNLNHQYFRIKKKEITKGLTDLYSSCRIYE